MEKTDNTEITTEEKIISETESIIEEAPEQKPAEDQSADTDTDQDTDTDTDPDQDTDPNTDAGSDADHDSVADPVDFHWAASERANDALFIDVPPKQTPEPKHTDKKYGIGVTTPIGALLDSSDEAAKSWKRKSKRRTAELPAVTKEEYNKRAEEKARLEQEEAKKQEALRLKAEREQARRIEAAKKKAAKEQAKEQAKKEAAKKKAEKKKAKKAARSKHRKRRIFLRIVIVFICLILAGMGAAVGYVEYRVRNAKAIDLAMLYSHVEMSTLLYDADGHEIDKIYYTENRETVSIDDIPEVTKNAFIAIEDKTFYKHHGFNFIRIAGAVFNKLIGRSEEIRGTSTITQQLARNVFLADVKSQRSLDRKFNEMLYALEIERALTKDQILEAYLNTIYLGYGNYGIYAAAHSYFDKDVSELDLAESAALAALPQAPDSYALLKDDKEEGLDYLKKYDVYANDLSKDRRDLVLDLMFEQGFITAKEADEAKVDIKDILKPGSSKYLSSEYTYFADYAISEVVKDIAEKYEMTDEEAQRFVYTGGLHIYTTVDPDIQSIINKEFSDDYNFPWSEERTQAAMVVTETGTGKVRAMVGGRGAVGRKLFNRATSPRQPGSSIKPLSVYSAALQKSLEFEAAGKTFPYIDFGYDRQGTRYWGNYITASSLVIDERMYVNGQPWPENFTRKFTGRQTFRTALQQSINTCAVKIQLQVGASYSMDMLKKYGISTAVDDTSQSVNDLNPAALALGAMTYGTTPLDMAAAYAVFPNGGIRYSPVCYTEVTDPMGNVILKSSPDKVKVLDEGVAFIMTDCLKSVVSRGGGRNAYVDGVQSGGKTGTTNDTSDIWFCGFVPSYSAALWIGTDHNSQMYTTSTMASALWGRIMRQIPDVTKGSYKEMPSNVIWQYGEYYTRGTQPWYSYYWNQDSQDDSGSDDEDDDSNTGKDKKKDKDEEDSDEWVKQWLEEN